MEVVRHAHDCFMKGDVNAAISHYSTALSVLQDNSGTTSFQRSALLCNRAMCHLRQKNMDAVLMDAQLALKWTPQYGPAIQLVVQCMIAKGQGPLVGPFVNQQIPFDIESFVALQPHITTTATGGEKGQAQPTPLHTAPPPTKMDIAQAKVYLIQASEFLATGQYAKAESHYTKLLTEGYDKIHTVHAGRGTARALQGRLHDALSDLQNAIRLNSSEADLYCRLGQVHMALGQWSESVKAYGQAEGIDPNHEETMCGRIQSLMKVHEYVEAQKVAARLAPRVQPTHPHFDDHMVLCIRAYSVEGSYAEAVKLATKAIDCQSTNPAMRYKLLLLLGSIYKDMGKTQDALSCLQSSYAIRPMAETDLVFTMTLYNQGRYLESIEMCTRGLKLQDDHEDMHYMRALMYFNCGQFSKCIAGCVEMSKRWKRHSCAYLGEYAVLMRKRLEQPFRDPAADVHKNLSPTLREALCKKLPKDISVTSSQISSTSYVDVDIQTRVPTPEQAKIFELADTLGSLLQLKCGGFASNKRSLRAAGLSILEMAQWLRKEKAAVGNSGWRDWIHIAVRWRSLVDVLDGVFWIDGMPQELYEEGFGSHTPVVRLNQRVYRYVPYETKLFTRAKQLVMQQYVLTDDMEHNITNKATNYVELRKALGQDVLVIAPVRNPVLDTANTLEGVRIAIWPEEGHSATSPASKAISFGIRVPNTPDRNVAFDAVMAYCFQCYLDNPCEDTMLQFYYYWENFQPITRGSAMIGLLAVLSMLLAQGFCVNSIAMTGVQFDWECLLSEAEDVIALMKPFITEQKCEAGEMLGTAPLVEEHITTYRDAFWAMNCYK